MSNADLADFADKDKLKKPARPVRPELIAPALGWALVLAILAVAIPQFERVFKDFGIDLSWSMRLIIKASHLWLAVLGAVVVLLVIDSIVRDALESRGDGRRMAKAWSGLMFAIPMTAFASIMVSIVLTFIGLLTKLTG